MESVCDNPPVRKKILFAVLVLFLALVAAVLVVGPPKVPKEAIASSVRRDAALLDRAFELPAAKAIGRELYWQSNGSFCGPASVVNVLRSFGVAAENEGAVLDGSGYCRLGMCFMGLTLDQLAEVARRKTTKNVTVLRDLTPDQFRAELLASNDATRRYVVNFTRKAIFGAGGGHHSPVGGYLEDADLVLVLDVNHDFQPWLIERARLFAAIDTVDSSSGKKRGLLKIE